MLARRIIRVASNKHSLLISQRRTFVSTQKRFASEGEHHHTVPPMDPRGSVPLRTHSYVTFGAILAIAILLKVVGKSKSTEQTEEPRQQQQQH
jgi:hypothetical protein